MRVIIIFLVIILFSCSRTPDNQNNQKISADDSLALLKMIKSREAAMVNKDINSVMIQFDSNSTFINGGGFYYENFDEINNFHRSMFENDSLTYSYKIGNPLISVINKEVAVVYYSWQQLWTMTKIQSDTLNEYGLMTIIAIKQKNAWKWKTITNQRTKEFFTDLKSHKGQIK